jgi:hypothetical protein
MAPTNTPALSETPTFQEAFAAAKAEHEKVAATTDGQAADDATAEGDDKPEPVADAKPKAAETTEKPADAKPAETTGLLSDQEFTTLQAKHAKDPAALLKELNRAFTTKTQALSAERKTFERMRPYVELIDAYEEDPAAVVRALAEQNGLRLADVPAKETTTETAATDTAVDEVMTEFKAALGPELEYLADGLAPAITKLVERLTQTTGEKTVAPLKKQMETLLSKAAQDQTETVMKSFGEKHPDWQEHEAAMLELAQRVQPKEMTEPEFLEHLYATVTRDTWEKDRETKIAEGVKARLAKITKGAEATETREESTPDSQVKKRPVGPVDFRQAYDDAKRGIRYED